MLHPPSTDTITPRPRRQFTPQPRHGQYMRPWMLTTLCALALTVHACAQDAPRDGAGTQGRTDEAAQVSGTGADSGLVTGTSCAVPEGAVDTTISKGTRMSGTMNKSDDEWRRELDPEAYRILRQKGTERAFTGKYYQTKDDGTYVCAGCRTPLFSSKTKYDSGSGWPSYWEPIFQGAVVEERDVSYGMIRTEVVCASCGGHLGHVFEDGPAPTGLRYCINSASLEFTPSTPRSGNDR